jgi:hypothetical protein
LRRVVIVVGIGAAAGGAVTIACLPLDGAWRAVLLLVWALMCSRDLWVVATGHRHCTGIRIEHTGNMLVYKHGNGCCTAAISAGSVVLQQIAWLRFQAEDGRRHVELIRRKTAQNKDWRRFQVIWRHLGAGR